MPYELRQLLDQNGMTQAQLAAQIGMTEAHVSRVVNGHTPISSKLRWRLSLIFGFDTAAQILDLAKSKTETEPA